MSEKEKSQQAAKNQAESETKKPIPEDKLSVTKHSVTINGKKIDYTVTAGTIVLKEEAEKKGETPGESEGEKPKASIFFMAYTRDGVKDASKRPITFSFNGGPGSASVWLHLGLLGPRRVKMDETGNPLPPPYQLVNNEHSLLDQTDLVFIDPVSTGYSRILPGEKAKEYHGIKRDVESVGDFIRLYATRYHRWASPKFLIGESYGTTRAAGLSSYLQERHGMYLNGIMLVSAILNFQTARFAPGNDLPFILFLPTYTAIAWYHKQLDKDLQKNLRKTLDEVERFAANEYTLALMKGSALSGAERAKVVKQLARFTGLTEDYIERTDLRIEIQRFVKELLRDDRRTVGRLDGRFTGVDRDSAGENNEFDPSLMAILGPYAGTFYNYVRKDLKFESDLPYEILTMKVHPWSYAEFENEYVNVAETLRKAMSANGYLKVHVANGYYDLATPYFATEYTFSHLGLDSSLQKNISMSYYEAGHMMYVHLKSLEIMKRELTQFISSAL
ncbi:peptidase S10 [Candidatus Acetothermia bacterium]|nr:peptidase S10 [Candidatus Acetothermia bacterium]MBI3643617.1 peptidase S10 [Candidatus Acetothermia bacterium]